MAEDARPPPFTAASSRTRPRIQSAPRNRVPRDCSASLAEAPKQLGEPLSALLGQPFCRVVVVGPQQIVVECRERYLVHAATFALGAALKRRRLLLAQPKRHRHAATLSL